jgi:hypothetical protein
MGKATKMLKDLDELSSPKAGRIVDHVPDEQISRKTIKLSEPTTENE